MTAVGPDKFCPGCRQYHPRSAFWRNRRHLDGLQLYCRPCLKARQLASALKSVARQAAGAAPIPNTNHETDRRSAR